MTALHGALPFLAAEGDEAAHAAWTRISRRLTEHRIAPRQSHAHISTLSIRACQQRPPAVESSAHH
eukprot:6179856-Pleurochrysis_carterae.AAC.9